MKKRKLLPLVPLAVMTVMLSVFYHRANSQPYEVELERDATPTFREVALPFVHHHGAESLPFVGSAVLDVDADGVPEVFIGGGANQPDGLFTFRDGCFVDTSGARGLDKVGSEATYGAASLDVNGDGKVDLLVARDTGVHLYINRGSTFAGRKLDIPFNEKSVPLSVALTDLNGDGHVDMFVATYLPKSKIEGQNIFNKQGYGATSLLLLNNGDETFTDITRSAGLEYVHNTFQGVFLDLDADGLVDLVVAHDTGQVRTWKNLGGLKFADVPNPTSTQYGYPMGIAVGDYDNDGRTDLFFSNVGGTPPRFMVKGDLRDDQVFNTKLMLLHNEGQFRFRSAEDETRTAGYEFSWGAVFEDFNLDGRQDLVIAQNYIGFPPHRLFRLPGRLLIQRPDHTFASAERLAGAENRRYEITPLAADFNGDGYPDLVRVNLDGPAIAQLNAGGAAHHLKVALDDVPQSLGATVTVETQAGKTLTSNLVIGEGLCSDQTHVLTFGLGAETGLAKVTVKYLSGASQTVLGPAVDATLKLHLADATPAAPGAAL